MPLAAADVAAARRFAGYPAVAATAYLPLSSQAASAQLDAVLAGLSDLEVADIQAQLVTLMALDAGIAGAGDSLDTAKAAVWTRNPLELAERSELFLAMRRRLCSTLGVPPGPGVYAEAMASAAAGSTASVASTEPAIFIV